MSYNRKYNNEKIEDFKRTGIRFNPQDKHHMFFAYLERNILTCYNDET